MKKILVTGTNSYIGTSFEKWVSQYPEKYSVEKISLRDSLWRGISFKDYDAVYHTAAIVHVKVNDESEYYRVNKELTIELAQKAKREGVKQFIFLSTMGVYGTETGYIKKDTLPTPKTHYAKSKYEAEQALNEMNTSYFNIAILRPPIVYGENCPGNFTRLINVTLKLPIFPEIKNERSMIYINNLSEFVRLIIDQSRNGLFFPQNEEYVCTSHLVKTIARVHEKRVWMTKLFNPILRILNISTVNKVFGNFVYEKELSKIGSQYSTCSFEESIRNSEVN